MNHSPHPPGRTGSEPHPRRKVGTSTLIGTGFGLFLLAVGLLTGGIGGAVVMAALLALVTGMYTVLTGRRSWARLPGRKAGSILTAASVVAIMVGSALLPPVELTVPIATAEPTETAAAEPSASSSPVPNESPAPAPSPTPDVGPAEQEEVPEPEGAPAAPQDRPESGTRALALLETLLVKGRAPKTGYDRDQFGEAWLDVDRNGCDTRNDMLNRDLRDIVHANSVPCKVQSGTLEDPYTGTSIPFLRGQDTSSDVQIDHVVALADAWQKGAQQLTFEQRVAFANDPLNLQSTDGPTNAQKGAGDAATWLPPNRPFRCEYVARQISVKVTYRLWVTQAEHDAMTRVLSNCADMVAPTGQPLPTPIAEPQPREQLPAPVPAPRDVYYENCAAARAAGAAPVYAEDPGYASHLDGDGDGVGCE